MGPAVDDQGAGTADAFPAVGVEGDGGLAAQGQLLVELVEHLQERDTRLHVGDRVLIESARVGGVPLTPNAQLESHVL
jgi:hypothetical protein